MSKFMFLLGAIAGGGAAYTYWPETAKVPAPIHVPALEQPVAFQAPSPVEPEPPLVAMQQAPASLTCTVNSGQGVGSFAMLPLFGSPTAFIGTGVVGPYRFHCFAIVSPNGGGWAKLNNESPPTVAVVRQPTRHASIVHAP